MREPQNQAMSHIGEFYTYNLRCGGRNRATSDSGAQAGQAQNMFSIICGAVLIIVTGATFWYLLPRNGQVHPFVESLDGGSMITIVIMTVFTFGVVIMTAGFIG
jgi:hypothetical protein